MNSQRGGFFVGMIVGLVIGLALALGVALYINKVPLPFVDKVPQRTADQNAAEAEHNKNWDPNSPLYGKTPAVPHAVEPDPDAARADAGGPTVAASAPKANEWSAPTPPPASQAKSASSARSASSGVASARNPASILSGGPVSSGSAPEALSFQIQAGAYGSPTEAEQQRAKLAIMGLEAQIQEREISGRPMYRVRLGPYSAREPAEEVRSQLSAAGIESALVRIQK